MIIEYECKVFSKHYTSSFIIVKLKSRFTHLYSVISKIHNMAENNGNFNNKEFVPPQQREDEKMERFSWQTLQSYSMKKICKFLVPIKHTTTNKSKYEEYMQICRIGKLQRYKVVTHAFNSIQNDLLADELSEFVPLSNDLKSLVPELNEYVSEHECKKRQLSKSSKTKYKIHSVLSPATKKRKLNMHNSRKRDPSRGLQTRLSSGKGPKNEMNGWALLDLLYVNLFADFVKHLQLECMSNPKARLCYCGSQIDIGGANNRSVAMTPVCDVICKNCGHRYAIFYFGGKVKVDGKNYWESALRFAQLTNRIKERYPLAPKLQVIYGIHAMHKDTFKRAKKKVVETTKAIVIGSMDEAIEQEKIDKIKYNRKTRAACDTGYHTKKRNASVYGQFNMGIKTDNPDPETGRTFKITACIPMSKYVNHKDKEGKALGSGLMESSGLTKAIKDQHKKGLVNDYISADGDTKMKKAIKDMNRELNEEMKKRDDLNHLSNSMLTKSLRVSNNKIGRKHWEAHKKENKAWTQPIHSQWVGHIHKNIHTICRARRDSVTGGKPCDLVFKVDMRLEVKGAIGHYTNGHEICKQNKFAKEYCKNIDDPTYVPEVLKNNKGEYVSYPQSEHLFDAVWGHVLKYLSDEGIDSMCEGSISSNPNENFNSVMGNICDKKKWIGWLDYQGYAYTTVGFCNYGERVLTIKENEMLNLKTYDSQHKILNTRRSDRIKKQKYQNNEKVKDRRVHNRYKNNRKISAQGKHYSSSGYH
eukprot:463042_1